MRELHIGRLRIPGTGRSVSGDPPQTADLGLPTPPGAGDSRLQSLSGLAGDAAPSFRSAAPGSEPVDIKPARPDPQEVGSRRWDAETKLRSRLFNEARRVSDLPMLRALLDSDRRKDADSAQDSIDDALMKDLEVSLDQPRSGGPIGKPAAKAPQSLDDEMTKLLGELSSQKR